MAEDKQQLDIRMDASALYLEESFTDRRVGTISRLTPMLLDGKRDEQRDILYIGQAQMMTGAGPLPLTFDLEADSLHQAVEKYGDAANVAATEMVDKLKEMQRESASGIVMPGNGAPAGQGGMPGGGKIKL